MQPHHGHTTSKDESIGTSFLVTYRKNTKRMLMLIFISTNFETQQTNPFYVRNELPTATLRSLVQVHFKHI